MKFVIICVILISQYHFKLYATSSWRLGLWSNVWNRWRSASAKVGALSDSKLNVIAFVALGMLIVVLLNSYLSYFAAFVLLWFCLDAFPASERQDELQYRFQNLFVIWFWFVLLGIYPAMFYFLLLLALNNSASSPALAQLQVIINAFEWLPARLLGLSIALVSSLMAVLGLWLNDLLSGLDPVQPLLNRWMDAAIKSDGSASLQRLLSRSALLWLVVLALLSAGAFVA